MILELRNGDFIDEEAYGLASWGSYNQIGIEKDEDGNWVEIHSNCVDPQNDIWHVEEEILDVKKVHRRLPKGKTLKNQDESDDLKEITRQMLTEED